MAPKAARRTRLVVIGASTGGPQAITRVLGALPGSFPIPIAIVLHMPPGYTSAIAERLAKQTAFDVREADGGLVLQPGRIVVARSGIHLKVAAQDGSDDLVCRLDVQPLHSAHRPAVDEPFHSAAAVCGAGVLGVVLTGMGVDGLAGSRSIRAAGGRVLAESASSAVVDGMPRAIREAGLSFRDVPLEGIADAIVEAV